MKIKAITCDQKQTILTHEIAKIVGSYQPRMKIKAITCDQKQTILTHEIAKIEILLQTGDEYSMA